MPHGEYKTEGGKLVIVDFQVKDGVLSDVSVSGDFFLEPPEALEQINGALNGMPATSSEAELAADIHGALGEGVEMVGFSPEAVAAAIRRGLDDL